jgi:tetratricopeptide (TPR) repeat protein
VWNTYASILISEGKKLEATAALETASHLHVADSDGLLLLGDLYAEQRFYPEAAEVYRQAMVQSGDIGFRRLVRYARTLVAEHQLDRAAEVMPADSPDLPRHSRILLLEARAELLSARGDLAGAQRELGGWLRLDPLNGAALMRQGDLYKLQGDLPRASFAYEQASQTPDVAYRASLELSNLALKERHYDTCINYIEKALAIERSPALESYLAKLEALNPEHDENSDPTVQ